MLRRKVGTVGAVAQIAFGAIVWLTIVLNAWHGPPSIYAADDTNFPMGLEHTSRSFSPDRAFFGTTTLGSTQNNGDKEADLNADSSLVNWQAVFTSPSQSFLDETQSSGLGLELFYNFDQSSSMKGLALSGGAEYSNSRDTYRIDNRLRSFATRMLESESVLHRLHLNVSWSYNSEPQKDELDSSYAVIVGYDYRIGRDMMLIFDFVHEKEVREGKEANVAEAGVSYQLMPLAVLAIGGGATFDDESPGFRSAFTFQYSF